MIKVVNINSQLAMVNAIDKLHLITKVALELLIKGPISNKLMLLHLLRSALDAVEIMRKKELSLNSL